MEKPFQNRRKPNPPRESKRSSRPDFERRKKPGSHFSRGKKKVFGKPFSKPLEEKTNLGGTRLNKYLANAGICSRREADTLIAAGAVTVNGVPITQMGYRVNPGDVVKYNNAAVRTEKMVYVLLNKPKDYITTTDDPFERKTVMQLVESAGKERIYPVGRLDRDTTGLLLITNDGELTKKLTHPSHQVEKIYFTELDQPLTKKDMEQIAEGVQLDDGMAHVDAISYAGDGNDKKLIGLELHTGRNRIVRRIFEALGYKVRKLDRVVFAGLTKKDLPRGRWRFLTEMEVNGLKMRKGN